MQCVGLWSLLFLGVGGENITLEPSAFFVLSSQGWADCERERGVRQFEPLHGAGHCCVLQEGELTEVHPSHTRLRRTKVLSCETNTGPKMGQVMNSGNADGLLHLSEYSPSRWHRIIAILQGRAVVGMKRSILTSVALGYVPSGHDGE